MNEAISTVVKPWGQYSDIFRTSTTVFKEMVIRPGKRTSLQTHLEREEFHYVVCGEGKLVYGDSVIDLYAGVTTLIPVDMPHRIECTGEKSLIIHEMQCGKCYEADIVRLEDDYGR